MKTLYKNTSRIAVSLIAGLVLSTGAALALTHKGYVAKSMSPASPTSPVTAEITDMGRFVVTPTTLRHAAAPDHLGRLVVTPQRMAHQS